MSSSFRCLYIYYLFLSKSSWQHSLSRAQQHLVWNVKGHCTLLGSIHPGTVGAWMQDVPRGLKWAAIIFGYMVIVSTSIATPCLALGLKFGAISVQMWKRVAMGSWIKGFTFQTLLQRVHLRSAALDDSESISCARRQEGQTKLADVVRFPVCMTSCTSSPTGHTRLKRGIANIGAGLVGESILCPAGKMLLMSSIWCI